MAEATGTPSDQIFQILTGFWTSRVVYIAAKLGLADLVQDGPKTAVELAEATGTHAPSLFRVLRALAGAGLFVEDDKNRFHVTPVGATLRTGIRGSLRSSMISGLGGDHYDAWGDLLHSVKTGETAFDHHFGMPVWQYYSENPEIARIFNESMTGLTRSIEKAVLDSYDFSPYHHVIDVGGGHGTFLASILKANPAAKGTLFDSPQVIAEAQAHVDAAELGQRCELVGGDFFTAVPENGDLYTLKWIIHDWDDARSLTILKNCHRSMAPGGRLLVVDTVIPPGNDPSPGKLMDVNMLVMAGGRERTEPEFRDLFAAAGFRLTRVIPTPSLVALVEAVRQED